METPGSDDMWDAITQINMVGMIHCLSCERKFLSNVSKLIQARSLCNIRSVFPNIFYTELMEQQQCHLVGLGIKKRKRKALQGTKYGSGVQVRNMFDTIENLT